MGILARYLWKEFFKLLAICQLIFMAIYMVVEFVQKIDNFMEVHAPRGAIFAYIFYKIPYLAVQMVPAATLISVVVMFSLMRKRNEITALKASGMSIFRISLPVIFASVCLAVAVFLFSELVVPYASSKSQAIWKSKVGRQGQAQTYSRDRIWIKGPNSIYWVRHFDGRRMVMEDLTLYFFDDSFHLIKRIQAKRAVWAKDRWRVEDGVIQVALDGDGYNFTKFREIDLNLPERPKAFLIPAKKPEELKRFAKRIQVEGYDATRYLVDMNIKLAFPVISLIMVLIGIPISLALRKGGTPLAVTLGIGACFLYLLNLGIARSLGLSGILPPALAAWLANLIFLLLGIYLMMHVET